MPKKKSKKTKKSPPAESLPLAVKYRPTRLDDVIGQETAVNAIRGFLKKKRIPNTILISGPYGCGKTTLARLLCLYINCEEPTKNEPCGKCPSCKQMGPVILGKGEHSDLVELDAATKRGIADMRELQHIAELSPMNNRRVIVLDECQEITPQGWKANLKTFEHPPGRSLFILCTTDPEKVPKAIVSRSHRLSLRKVPNKQLLLLLKTIAKAEGYVLKKKDREQIVNISQNHPRDALQILESVLNYIEYKGKDTLKDLSAHFPEILSQTETYKTYIAVQYWFTAIFAGKYGPAFGAIDKADNHIFFLDQAILVFRQIVRQWINSSLVDQSKFWALKEVKFPNQDVGRDNLNKAAEVLNLLLTAQSKIKTYLHDPVGVIEHTTLSIIPLTSTMTPKKKKRKKK